MEKSNTLEYLRLLNQSSKENLKINNKNIIELLLDCIEFNQKNYIEEDKYLYVYNYINIFREYYDDLKDKIKNNYYKLIKKKGNNQYSIENEIELIKYYRYKIYKKEIENNTFHNSKYLNNDENIGDFYHENYLSELYDNVDTYLDDMCELYNETISISKNNIHNKNTNKKDLNKNKFGKESNNKLQQVPNEKLNIPNEELMELKLKDNINDILFINKGNKRMKINNNILFCN